MRLDLSVVLAAFLLLVLALQMHGIQIVQASGQAPPNPKVSPLLLDELRRSGSARAIIVLDSDSLVERGLERLSSAPGRGSAEVLSHIMGEAAASQEPVVRALSDMGIKVLDRLWLVNGIVVVLSAADLQRIASLPGIRAVYPDTLLGLVRPVEKIYMGGGEGPLAPLDNTSRRVVQADLVEALGINGSGVKVAILDTGIQADHPWLLRNGTSVVRASFDATRTGIVGLCTYLGIPSGHGTHVAGIVASQDPAHRGVAPGVDIYNVIVFSNVTPYNCELAASSWIIRGIEWALLGPDGRPGTGDEADVISMSLGAVLPPWFTAYVASQIPLIQAMARAVLAGVPVVVAAGNAGPGGYTINFLCLAPGVICVGASDSRRGTVATSYVIGFSSRGPVPFDVAKPDISAPGVAIVSSVPYNRTAAFSGTSMATPHVSGIVALLRQARPDWSVSDIKRAIVETGNLMPSTIYEGPNPMEQGGGLAAALNAIRTPIRLSLARGTDYGLTQTVVLSPGSSATVQLAVSNAGGSGVSVSFSAAGFESYGGFSRLPEGSIAFSPSSLEVAPGNVSTVSVSIKIPENVAPGTYSGYLVASSGEHSAKVSLTVVVRAPLHLAGPSGAVLNVSGILGFGPPEWIIYRVLVPSPPADVGIFSIISGLPAPARVYLITPSGGFISASGGVRLSEAGEHLLIVETADLALPEKFGLLLVVPNVSGLSQAISNVSSGLSRLASLLASHEAAISSLRDGLSGLNASLVALSDRVASQGAIISSLGRSLQDLNASLSDLSSRLGDAVSSINSRLNVLSSGLGDLQQRFSSFQQSTSSELRDLRSSVASLSSGLGDLQQRFSSFQQSTSSELRDLRSSVASLSSGLNATSSELRALIAQSNNYAFTGIGVGAVGLVLGIVALVLRGRARAG